MISDGTGNVVEPRGMLVKGGKVLDALAQCSTVAFDKTGTLTQGQLACTAMLSLDDQPFAPSLDAQGLPLLQCVPLILSVCQCVWFI